MKRTGFAKLEEFLSRTPVLVERPVWPTDCSAKKAARHAAVLAGAPLNEAELEHRRLSREFERRLNALGLGRAYIVIDRTRDDISTLDAIQETITRRYRGIAAPGNNARLGLGDACTISQRPNNASCILLEEQDGWQPCFVIKPNDSNINLSTEFAERLMWPASGLRKPLPVSRENLNRMLLFHESFGHGTEDTGKFYHQDAVGNANCELRAEIAAMIGIIHDTGHVNAAKSMVHAWNLHGLRCVAIVGWIRDDFTKYANGKELGQALKSLPAIPDIRRMDDRGLVRLIDEIFTPLALDETRYNARTTMLGDAFRLASDAEEGKNTTLTCLSPKRLASAIGYLQDCMKAHAFFMKPAQTPRPNPASPVPRPVMP